MVIYMNKLLNLIIENENGEKRKMAGGKKEE